jgi:hypothetical protein
VEETIDRAEVLKVFDYIFAYLIFEEIIYLVEIGVLYYSEGIRIRRFYLVNRDSRSP